MPPLIEEPELVVPVVLLPDEPLDVPDSEPFEFEFESEPVFELLFEFEFVSEPVFELLLESEFEFEPEPEFEF